MKKVLFYSPDFNFCYSLLMYLQDKYNVTSSTDLSVLESLSENSDFDLLIIDAEPDLKIEQLCSDIKNSHSDLKIILTYVYDEKMNSVENRVKKYISGVLYKPFNLTEFSKFLPGIVSDTNTQTV